METKDVKLDSRVKWIAGEHEGKEGILIDYKAGWAVVEMDTNFGEGDVKCRLKDIEIIPSRKGDPKPTEETVDSAAEEIPDGVARNIKCETCLFDFEDTTPHNNKCPECGWMNNVRLEPDKDKYVTGKGATASDRDTVDIDDDVANQLRGMGYHEVIEATAKIIKSIGPNVAFAAKDVRNFAKFSSDDVEDYLWAKYEHLNPGMVRMNCGNLLRGAVKRQEAAKKDA